MNDLSESSCAMAVFENEVHGWTKSDDSLTHEVSCPGVLQVSPHRVAHLDALDEAGLADLSLFQHYLEPMRMNETFITTEAYVQDGHYPVKKLLVLLPKILESLTSLKNFDKNLSKNLAKILT